MKNMDFCLFLTHWLVVGVDLGFWDKIEGHLFFSICIVVILIFYLISKNYYLRALNKEIYTSSSEFGDKLVMSTERKLWSSSEYSYFIL